MKYIKKFENIKNNFYILKPSGTVLNILSMTPCNEGTCMIHPLYKYINDEIKRVNSKEIEIDIKTFNHWKVYGPSTLKDVLEIAPTLDSIKKYNL